jgi:hypothetical protein
MPSWLENSMISIISCVDPNEWGLKNGFLSMGFESRTYWSLALYLNHKTAGTRLIQKPFHLDIQQIFLT